MDPRERLRLALIRVGCSRCGQPYPIDGVNVLAQREGIAFVQLECPACETRVLALVTGSPSDEGEIERAEWTSGSIGQRDHPDHPSRHRGREGTPIDEPHPAGERPSLDESDVDDMRRFLVDYPGDLRSLVEKGTNRRGAE